MQETQKCWGNSDRTLHSISDRVNGEKIVKEEAGGRIVNGKEKLKVEGLERQLSSQGHWLLLQRTGFSSTVAHYGLKLQF